MKPADAGYGGRHHTSRITRRTWLTGDTFILALARPANFRFKAGQRIRILLKQHQRDYSLIPGDTEDELCLLIRRVADGIVSLALGECPLESPLTFEGPAGHFIYRPSPRPAVFIATGTGIAPFAAMCREGTKGFILCHGVRFPEDLYFREWVEKAARQYVPCLSGDAPSRPPGIFKGYVTTYLREQMPAGDYDFYLAGRRDMIADAIGIIDQTFPTSRVYSEIFY